MQPYIGYAYIIMVFLSFFFMTIVFSIVSKDSDNFAAMGLICGVSPTIWPLTLPCFIIALFITLSARRESKNIETTDNRLKKHDFAIEPWESLGNFRKYHIFETEEIRQQGRAELFKNRL